MKIFIFFLSTALSAPAAVNIIDSTYGAGTGSFELGSYVQNSGNIYNYMRLPTASSTITGWSVGGPDGVDWLTTPGYAGSNGSFSVDIAGISHAGAATYGSINTTIATVIGTQYLISFDAYGPGDATGLLTAGSLSQTFLPPLNANTEVAAYQTYNFAFTALSASTTITFATTADCYGFGPVIDNVVVAVPEHSTGVLALCATLGLALRRRRA